MAKETKKVIECGNDDLVIVLRGAMPVAEKLGIDCAKNEGVLSIDERSIDKHGEYEGDTGWTGVRGERKDGTESAGISIGGPFKRTADYGAFSASGWFAPPKKAASKSETRYKRIEV